MSQSLQKIQAALIDAAKISKREIVRGMEKARSQIENLQHIQKRKELFAELGRVVFEYSETDAKEASPIFEQTEVKNLIKEIKALNKATAE